MHVARMPEPGATEGLSRQDLLSIYEQTKTIAIGTDVLWYQPGTYTTEAIQLAAGADLTVVAGRCMGATHGEPGLGPGPSRTDRPSETAIAQ
jgi:CoA binding domain